MSKPTLQYIPIDVVNARAALPDQQSGKKLQFANEEQIAARVELANWHRRPCSQCDASGLLEDSRTCPKCEGTGREWYRRGKKKC